MNDEDDDSSGEEEPDRLGVEGGKTLGLLGDEVVSLVAAPPLYHENPLLATLDSLVATMVPRTYARTCTDCTILSIG